MGTYLPTAGVGWLGPLVQSCPGQVGRVIGSVRLVSSVPHIACGLSSSWGPGHGDQGRAGRELPLRWGAGHSGQGPPPIPGPGSPPRGPAQSRSQSFSVLVTELGPRCPPYPVGTPDPGTSLMVAQVEPTELAAAPVLDPGPAPLQPRRKAFAVVPRSLGGRPAASPFSGTQPRCRACGQSRDRLVASAPAQPANPRRHPAPFKVNFSGPPPLTTS